MKLNPALLPLPFAVVLALVACSGPTVAPDASIPGDAATPVGAAVTDSGASAGGLAPTARAAITGTSAIAGPITGITDTLTYVEEGAPYTFDYPARWTLTSYSGAVAMLTSFPLDEPGHGGIAAGETKMDFTPDLELTRTSLDEMLTQTREQTSVVSEADITLPGGIPARRMTLYGPAGDELALLLTVIDGRGMRVLGYGDLTLFDPIVATLRSTK